jgi:hypothetical protein
MICINYHLQDQNITKSGKNIYYPDNWGGKWTIYTEMLFFLSSAFVFGRDNLPNLTIFRYAVLLVISATYAFAEELTIRKLV